VHPPHPPFGHPLPTDGGEGVDSSFFFPSPPFGGEGQGEGAEEAGVNPAVANAIMIEPSKSF
jgi:hypothetical protein